MAVRWSRLGIGTLPVAAAVVIAAGFIRYAQQPSFWLDEAFIAVALRTRTVAGLFSVLDYGQYFPRLYLGAIALISQVAGYHIWSLRLLPLLSFVIGTVLWAHLLNKRSRPLLLLGVLSALLLIGASFWLDQAIQVKQYTMDVALALVPFLLGDEFFEAGLISNRRKKTLVILALGCLISYTYPFALGARLLGWYLWRGRRAGWRINTASVAILLCSLALALAVIWLTDYRFNLTHRAAYLSYWNDCILSSAFSRSASNGVRLIAKFLWGWHGREPLVTAVIAPLQLLGVYSVIKRWRGRGESADWGSRSLGSIVLLLGMILASLILGYPICAGRVTLFAQVHTQLLAIEGASFLLMRPARPRATGAVVAVVLGILAIHSVRDYVRFVRAESPENIRPMLPLIKPEIADTVWVHSCSVAQVRSLPDSLPLQNVRFGAQAEPRRGERMWILWTHLGAESCQKELEQMRSRAQSWQIVVEGPGRGLALAEF